VIELIREYGKENPDLFEVLMAFVIGHELSHFVRDDFKRVDEMKKQAAGHESNSKNIMGKKGKIIELKADEIGFLYAAFAGYKVGLLVKHKQVIIDFLTHFFKATSNSNYDVDKGVYPTPAQRAAQAIILWEILHAKYPFYEYGVRLAIFDRCSIAILYFFSEFRRTYQGKEIQNNIGMCYLQLAKGRMQDAAYFYWLPGILDGDIESIITMGSTVTGLKNLRDARLIEVVKGNLEGAVKHFDLAIDVAPYYFPSYINLAISYLYLGDPDSAGLILNKGLKQYEKLDISQQDKNIEIQFKMLRLLAQYENTWFSTAPLQNVTNDLKKILQEYENPPLQVKFNLVRLLEVEGRDAEAQDYWNQLAQDEIRSQLPVPVLEIVCNEQQGIPSSDCLTSTKMVENTKQWPEPEEWTKYTGTKILDAVKANGWIERLKDDDWYKYSVSIYQSVDKKWEGLFIDTYSELLINREPNETFDNLKQYCSHSLRKKTLVENEVYLCDNWAAKVVDGKVTEVWMH
jgi:tetratricopeptide (TPR) repeat protein